MTHPSRKDDKDAIIARLRDEIEVLEERNRQLREVLAPSAKSPPAEWGLTRSQGLIYAHLSSRDMGTRESILAALYSDRAHDQPDCEVVHQFIFQLRHRLHPHGITIRTIRDQGYRLERNTVFNTEGVEAEEARRFEQHAMENGL